MLKGKNKEHYRSGNEDVNVCFSCRNSIVVDMFKLVHKVWYDKVYQST